MENFIEYYLGDLRTKETRDILDYLVDYMCSKPIYNKHYDNVNYYEEERFFEKNELFIKFMVINLKKSNLKLLQKMNKTY